MKPWPYPRLFAHRGGGSLAPENTLAAIRMGQSHGYTAHEIDVKLTRDGVLVLLHDPTLERTTNGKGRAADLRWEELRTLDAGSWHSAGFAGERIPTFEEATALFRAKGTTVNIEIKPTPGFDRATGVAAAKAVRELWKGAPLAPFFSSFSFEALMAAGEEAPEIGRAWLVDTFTEADWDRLKALEAVALHTNHRKLELAEVPRLHEAGYRVNLYTVNEADRAEMLFSAGVDGMFTDNLEVFAQRFPDFR
ncbi:MAG TPA: glycerophosphodiester phosphodiesterase [Usitatibacter sp.]|nr:glycerophosphodiester phosphodiesterase [Usitatibacter sp.]